MYTHAVFSVSSVVGTGNARICRRIKAQISLNCCGSHFFSHTAAAASDGSNDPAALAPVHPRFLLSHRIFEQHWHMHNKASASGFSLLAALSCGKIQSSRPRRNRSTLFSTVFSALLSSWFLPFPRPLPCTATSSSYHTVLPAQRCWSIGSVRRGMAQHSRPLEACLFHQSPTRDQAPKPVDIVLHRPALIHSFAINEDQLCHRNMYAQHGRWRNQPQGYVPDRRSSNSQISAHEECVRLYCL